MCSSGLPHPVRSLRLAPGERAQIILDLAEGRPLRLVASSPDNMMGMMGGQGRGMMGGGMMGRGNDGDPSGGVFRILDIRPADTARSVRLPAELAPLGVPDPSLAVRTRRFVIDMGMMGDRKTSCRERV